MKPRKAPGEAAGERVIEGLGVAAGIAIGPAHLHESDSIAVPDYAIGAEQVESEQKRFADAVAGARRQIAKLKTKAGALHGSAAEEMGYLLDAHMQMLAGSRLVRGVEKRIAEQRINAERAVQSEIDAIAEGFARMDDAYLAERGDDIREVGDRLIRQLTRTPYGALAKAPAGSVLIAEDLTPADTALLDPKVVGGFATVLGGPEGHTAIMARSLALPAVVGVSGLLAGVRQGEMVIVDGTRGEVTVSPSPATLERARARQEALRQEQRQLLRVAKLPSITRDGAHVTLEANIELPAEVDLAVAAAAEGIGLLRTEFLFMNREQVPDEEEQYKTLREIVRGMGGKPVTIRTLDIGNDKLIGTDGATADTANPALGLRAIRLSLQRRDLLEAQLAAILRAAAHGPVRILLPMITSEVEINEVRDVLRGVARRLKRRGQRQAEEMPPLGAMIEVPGAALSADALALAADFFALGTNDLTQYTLAIDRGDEQVAHLYNPLHPAVLRLIQFTVEAALRARIPVSVCGEMASDPRFLPLLLGLGIRDLSMAPVHLLRVKQRLRAVDLDASTRRARTIMEQADPVRIAALLDEFNGGA
ncbi:MAG: phosphoenolpyruvate--protein phosphotransferase [Alphaproteobacteria bacterium]|nr:phosphoenolpyruvate--protein phosphotransferase [Alphaproteobacteria bacterium]